MNIPEPDLEKILLLAPSPKPPTGLKERLLAHASSSARRSSESSVGAQTTTLAWLRRWWPAFAPAMISLVCAVVLAVQQNELRDLKHSLEILASKPVQAEDTQALRAMASNQSSGQASDRDEAEIERLKQLIAQLSSEVMQLEQWRAENEKLRARLATPQISGLSPAET